MVKITQIRTKHITQNFGMLKETGDERKKKMETQQEVLWPRLQRFLKIRQKCMQITLIQLAARRKLDRGMDREAKKR